MKLSKFVKRAKSESYCMVIHADDSGIGGRHGRAGGGAGEGKPERCRNGKAGVVLPGAARWRAKK